MSFSICKNLESFQCRLCKQSSSEEIKIKKNIKQLVFVSGFYKNDLRAKKTIKQLVNFGNPKKMDECNIIRLIVTAFSVDHYAGGLVVFVEHPSYNLALLLVHKESSISPIEHKR